VSLARAVPLFLSGGDRMNAESPSTLRRVADIMARDIVALSPEMELREAAAAFSEHQISGAPVCAADGRLLGVLSTTDVSETCADPVGSPPRVGQAMTPAVLSIDADDPIQRAVEKMAYEGVHRLIVVVDGRPVGIVTAMDILRELAGYPRHEERLIAVAPPEDPTP
jgi:predicted transcriptional regulator